MEHLSPGPSDLEVNSVFSAYSTGNFALAEQSARELIKKYPVHPFGWKVLGVILKLLGRLTEALEPMQQAVRFGPEDAESNSNLGIVLKDLGRLSEAETSYRAAILLRPELAEAHNNLANMLKDLGRMDEAIGCYREALRLNPDYTEARSNLLFSYNYVAELPVAAALEEAKAYGARVSSSAMPKFDSWPVRAAPATLKVGLVSGDLYGHPVGYFVEGLIEQLDPGMVELYAFSTSRLTDDLTARIQPKFRQWISLVGQPDAAAAKLIHNLGIHVLIDLSGHSSQNRLPVFAYRPAPVQASYLGYFASTGLPEMDYFLGDPIMSPAHEAHTFTEKVWNLSQTWLCMMPPAGTPEVAPAPALKQGHVTFGNFGNLSKMNDRVVACWSRLLQGVPASTLMLKSRQLQDPHVEAAVRQRFARHGVEGNRLVLEGPVNRHHYFQSYHKVDMVLDTFPYPGGTTSVEALWMGVPVLTLHGDHFLSRLGASIAFNSGQADWIAKDSEDFVNKGIALASDPTRLNQIRMSLRDKLGRGPLFDTAQFARNFETALWGMWRDKLSRFKS